MTNLGLCMYCEFWIVRAFSFECRDLPQNINEFKHTIRKGNITAFKVPNCVNERLAETYKMVIGLPMQWIDNSLDHCRVHRQQPVYSSLCVIAPA